MARRVKFKSNRAGLEQLRRHPAIRHDIRRRAEAVKDAAGDGFEVGTFEGEARSRASVITASAKAKRKQNKNNTLQRSIDAARG